MIAKFPASPVAALKAAATVALAVCAAVFLFASIRWPLVGDSSLMHYVVFLMDRGAVPYRDIAEMNLPGTYLVEWGSIHLLGGGDFAWRVFDLLLVASAAVAMLVITLPLDWFAGVWASALFLLVHGRDGILELGQRELTISTFLLAAYAFLFLALRRGRPSLALIFGLLVGFSATMKPTVLPLAVLSLAAVHCELFQAGKPSRRFLLNGACGVFFPLLGAVFYLWWKGALGAFFSTILPMIVYHAGLARRPAGYLLLHSVSPILPLVALWIAIALLARRRLGWEQGHLCIAAGVGLFSYISQGKGYSYQRYPFLAFLLLTMAVDFAAALRSSGAGRLVAMAGICFGAFFLAPVSTAMAARYEWRSLGTAGMIEDDLKALGPAKLSGGVQCIDSIDGCINALYRMRLVETSPVFYDEFLFGPASSPAVRRNRQKFSLEIQSHLPSVILVTDRLFPVGPGDYAKLESWPSFNSLLQEQYNLSAQRSPTQTVRWWSKPEVPAGYRIYLRKPQLIPDR